MGKGTLTIYNASAGSGKTFTLAAIYLSHIFKSRFNYRHILAVTFTNKATAEMKSRILENLHLLASGGASEYLADLVKSTGKSESWIRSEAAGILDSILHDYSRFSVTTIDSFFQKILRAFAREAGLNSGFNVEMDNSIILSDAVDEVIRSVPENQRLKTWLKEYVLSNIEEERSWDLKESIMNLALEIFREKFKVLTDAELDSIADRDFLLNYIAELKKIIFSFEAGLKGYGNQAEAIYSEYGLADSMFYQKGKGIPGYISQLKGGTVKAPNSYVMEITSNPPKWTSGKPDAALRNAIDAGLEKVLTEAISFYMTGVEKYQTADSILKNIYSLGILSDILRKVREISSSENTFLLSESGAFLKNITGGDQTSFIYEKAGNRFDNYMIDEFQDTSELQWLNFKPLIENSMAQGHDNLVVGDVKQSIYRWRNSDWKILGSVLNQQVDNERILKKKLITNWRSCKNIVRFNNSLFSLLPAQIDTILSDSELNDKVSGLYSEAVQKDSGKQEGGYIRIEFVSDTSESGWQDIVLEKLPGVINSIRQKGYSLSDIGILVRDSREGAKILKRLIDFSNIPENIKTSNEIRVVSNDSLILSNSSALTFIMAVLAVVLNPSDMISRALMLRFFLLASENENVSEVPLIYSEIGEVERKYYPEGYEEHLKRLKNYTLFETTERIIQFYGLGNKVHNIPYLNAFQDLVLSFSGTNGNDIAGFIEWWEITGRFKSVVLPESLDAARILTIHKSKGLEFRILIIPFISWGLDHLPLKPPVLWVRPSAEPFNRIGIIPVRYGKQLEETIFRSEYYSEKFSAYIDNLNLLYVAFTRAREALYGFSNSDPRGENIASLLKGAFSAEKGSNLQSDLILGDYYNSESGVFELGTEKNQTLEEREYKKGYVSGYTVNNRLGSLRLRLHGEYYFHKGGSSFQDRINYGMVMHGIFERIKNRRDVSTSVKSMVLEGRIKESEYEVLEQKILNLISSAPVSEWFADDSQVMSEAGILLPTGNTRRPDRIIFRDERTILVDFKFGDQNPGYRKQIGHYRRLLTEMGYQNIESYLWYVDSNIIEVVQ